MTDLIAVQKIVGWQKLKTLVLDSVSSPITATHLLIVALFIQEDYFQLGLRVEIERLQASFAQSYANGMVPDP